MKTGLMIKLFFAAAVSGFLAAASGCSLFILDAAFAPDEYMPTAVLVIVEKSLLPEIETRIGAYRDDLSAEGVSIRPVLYEMYLQQ